MHGGAAGPPTARVRAVGTLQGLARATVPRVGKLAAGPCGARDRPDHHQDRLPGAHRPAILQDRHPWPGLLREAHRLGEPRRDRLREARKPAPTGDRRRATPYRRRPVTTGRRGWPKPSGRRGGQAPPRPPRRPGRRLVCRAPGPSGARARERRPRPDSNPRSRVSARHARRGSPGGRTPARRPSRPARAVVATSASGRSQLACPASRPLRSLKGLGSPSSMVPSPGPRTLRQVCSPRCYRTRHPAGGRNRCSLRPSQGPSRRGWILRMAAPR